MFGGLDLALALAPLYINDGVMPHEEYHPGIHPIDRYDYHRIAASHRVRKDLDIAVDASKVIALSEQGYSNREIAKLLGIGRNRINRCLQKKG